ncbi:hypothetical protein EG328_011163 [Venturia inaequalis]|uniref:DUF7587 domain-containing protein n=1 Tax=Venturia inaequalis TaxID=5025 RepID=A0A8H3V2S5_VENIN|nr:hypothetical protein EG327_006736 [Venturia inaequalis]KAE9988403.1 hypothetical protein EG328_011163 [Venturia inaequalis]RDI82227.1 Endoglucanase [Venturia inaequalis]
MANQQSFLQPLPPNYVPDILFRVDHNGRTGHWGFAGVPPSSNFDREQNLVARVSLADRHGIAKLHWQDFNNHLSWYPVQTPFLSFTSSWNRAARLREQKIRDGYKDVNIVAI